MFSKGPAGHEPGAPTKQLAAFADALHDFGRELACPICMSLMKKAQMGPCGHVFCK